MTPVPTSIRPECPPARRERLGDYVAVRLSTQQRATLEQQAQQAWVRFVGEHALPGGE